MRWRWPIPSIPEEESARIEVAEKIERWWEEFARRAGDLDAHFTRGLKMDIPAWIEEHLQGIERRLMWEFGPALKGGHRLVITPESEHHLRPLVEAILGRAPKLKGWEFFAYRLVDDWAWSQSTFKGRTGKSLEGVRVRAARGKANGIDLVFQAPWCGDKEDKAAGEAAMVATEILLGEELLDKWIGFIEAAPLPKRGFFRKLVGDEGVPAEALKGAVEGMIGEIQGGLPPQPRHLGTGPAVGSPEEETAVRLYEMEPEEREDYPGRSDLWIAQSEFPEMWEATATHSPAFSSARFSRCGETFAYLKLDRTERPDLKTVAVRGELEDAVCARLKPAGAGAKVGGGTGLQYSYIDFALTDVAKAIPIMRAVLQEWRAPERSWLLFFDPELADEWVGIWGGTPPPPREEEE